MADEAVTFQWLSIENFRGFRREQRIDLAGSAVIVCGPNGTGKTSLFDAIQWLLTGSLTRLAKLASRRAGGYVANRFAGRAAVARVSASLGVRGRSVTITRTGDHRSSLLTWTSAQGSVTGSEAEEALRTALLGDADMVLRDAMLTSGILQQDVVRAVLEDEPKDRYRHMAALLGLEDVTGFEAGAKRDAEELGRLARSERERLEGAEAELRRALAEVDRLQMRLAVQPDIAAVRGELLAEITRTAPHLAVSALPDSSTDAILLAQTARRWRATADQLLVEDARLRGAEASLSEVSADDVGKLRERENAAQTAAAEALASLQEARQTLREAEHRASDLADLAAKALPLLADHCPVCSQPINVAAVQERLRRLMGASGEDLTRLAEVVRIDEIRLQGRDEELGRIVSERQRLEALLHEREVLVSARQRWREECSASAVAGIALQADVLRRIQEGDVESLDATRSSVDRLASVADRLTGALSATALGDELARRRAEVATLTQEVASIRERAAATSQRAESARTLAAAATRAITAVTKERFSTLLPLLNDIFGRLAPHPAFTRMGFEMDVSYRSGVADAYVADPESGVTGDPLLLFSSSQANVAALTYFLAMSWAVEREGLPFVLLDDPLQSMDDVNALGFADLCRHIRSRRQLVLSTHEQRLAGLLQRKLSPRSDGLRTILVMFTGWDRTGPTIEQHDVGRAEVSFLLEAV